MNLKSISMIHKQLTTYFKVKNGYILIVYYKSHGVGNRKSICVAIIKIYWLIVILIKLFCNSYKNVIDLQYHVQY